MKWPVMIAGLALGSALGTNVAFLFKQRGARCWARRAGGSSATQRRGLVPLSLVLARVGGGGSCVGLHVGALALAPLPIARAVASETTPGCSMRE
jgi:hypothetical protein